MRKVICPLRLQKDFGVQSKFFPQKEAGPLSDPLGKKQRKYLSLSFDVFFSYFSLTENPTRGTQITAV